jgi:uncharacterized protein YaaQ
MKLIIAIVHDEDSTRITDELNKQGFSVTKLCSSGGFLRVGNTTLMTGTDDDRVNSVIDIILLNSEAREHSGGKARKVVASGATIFVSNVEQFEKF